MSIAVSSNTAQCGDTFSVDKIQSAGQLCLRDRACHGEGTIATKSSIHAKLPVRGDNQPRLLHRHPLRVFHTVHTSVDVGLVKRETSKVPKPFLEQLPLWNVPTRAVGRPLEVDVNILGIPEDCCLEQSEHMAHDLPALQPSPSKVAYLFRSSLIDILYQGPGSTHRRGP
jgi:hypothetical protein